MQEYICTDVCVHLASYVIHVPSFKHFLQVRNHASALIELTEAHCFLPNTSPKE